jgi:hypothetical protein
MNIKQVSVNYLPEQDRLLVRINTHGEQELYLWFTRRMTLALLPALRQSATQQIHLLVPSPEPSVNLAQQRYQMLENFQKEAAAYAGDFKTPYQAPPVAPQTRPELLITDIQMNVLASGQLQLQLQEKMPQYNRNVQLMMDAQMTQGVLHLVQQTLVASQWLESPPELPPLQPLPALHADVESEDSALAAEPSKPKYLN